MNNIQTSPVALITGAARRIGATIATYLHQAGFRIVIHCHRSKKEALALANQLNTIRAESAWVLNADLSDKSQVIKLINDTISVANQLDLLVNNASIFTKSTTNPLDEANWDNLFITNVKAPFWLSHSAFPHLVKQKGAIINITDIHADAPLKDYAVYCQSKAALAMQTKALAQEFAPNVRVNAVAPGAILWPEEENALSEKQQQKIVSKTLLKQHGDALYIAMAVLALAENPFITGQTLRVDGGRV